MMWSLKRWKFVLLFEIYFVLFVKSTGLGPCPRIGYLDKFNISRFTGHWNEIERSFYLMELISSCVSMDLAQTPRGQVEVSINTKSRWSGTFSISQGIATPTRRHPSVFLYRVNTKMPKVISRYLPGAGFYQVIKTDYYHYAVLYTCTNFELAGYPIAHVDLIWVLSKQKEISAEVRAEIYDFLASYYIDPERLILADHEDC